MTMGNKYSSLHTLVLKGDHKGVKALLKRHRNCSLSSRSSQITDDDEKNTSQFDINSLQDGKTPLLIAVSLLDATAVSLLLEYGADPNAPCTQDTTAGQQQNSMRIRWTAIHEACRFDSSKHLELLINSGANVDLQAHHEMSPLHIAAWHGKEKNIQTLIAAGCDVNQQDGFRESAMVMPICQGDTHMVQVLLNAGCKFNGRSWGNTRKIQGKFDQSFRATLYGREGPYSYLILAITFNWLQIARMLLIHGFNPNKYQLHDILKAIKSTKGTIDEDGKFFIRCYLECGYTLRYDDQHQLDKLLVNTSTDAKLYDEDYINFLKTSNDQPHSLKNLCKFVVRNHIGKIVLHGSILSSLKALPLPKLLIEDLCLAKLDLENETLITSDDKDIVRNTHYCAMPRQPVLNAKRFNTTTWQSFCCVR